MIMEKLLLVVLLVLLPTVAERCVRLAEPEEHAEEERLPVGSCEHQREPRSHHGHNGFTGVRQLRHAVHQHPIHHQQVVVRGLVRGLLLLGVVRAILSTTTAIPTTTPTTNTSGTNTPTHARPAVGIAHAIQDRTDIRQQHEWWWEWWG